MFRPPAVVGQASSLPWPGRLEACPTHILRARMETMLHVALLEPEIPPNTGNVARLCAATGAVLHLVGRLGFRLDDRQLRRAGLDYWPQVQVRQHMTLEELESALPEARIIPVSSKVTRAYTGERYRDGDCLL